MTTWWIHANRWMAEFQHWLACYMLSINPHAPYWAKVKNRMDSELIRYDLDLGRL